tara:strand:+ start:782 stop:1267 length:486 start_codon:yes stop_codon:yes gene_type:complete
MDRIEDIEKAHLKSLQGKKKLPEFDAGDTIKVNVRILEGKRVRTQAFEGVCISKKSRGISSSFTVRKISFGEGVERVFQLFSPNLDSIEIIRSGKVRKAKLYYLRDRKGKSARINEKIKKKIGVELLDNTNEQKKDTSIDPPMEEKDLSKQKDPKKLEEKK